MAIKPSQIQTVLSRKRADFASFDRSTSGYLEQYQAAWAAWIALSEGDRTRWLSKQSGDLGAKPLEPITPFSARSTRSIRSIEKSIAQSTEQSTEQSIEQLTLENLTEKQPIAASSVTHDSGIIRSGLAWDNREQCLRWAKEHIHEVTTFAVDGSQVFPQKDFSIPIALVQIGWFENHHCAAGRYEKDILLDVMTPKDLVADQSQPMDRWINMRRFSMEVQRLIDYITHAKDRALAQGRDPEKCLVFFDGSLVLSFAAMLDENIRSPYIDQILNLLRASEKYQVPLVGYVDTAQSNDITTLLRTFDKLETTRAIHDAKLLDRLMNWGDRTPLMICDRGDILNYYAEMRSRIAFTYLKTNSNYPARLEMPSWIWETGRAEAVINQVLAEVIVGNGYPYAIETADQTAVLQSRDRQIFYRILQDWAAQEKIRIHLSQKMVSKARRR